MIRPTPEEVQDAIHLMEALLAAWQETHDLERIYSEDDTQAWTVEEAEEIIEAFK